MNACNDPRQQQQVRIDIAASLAALKKLVQRCDVAAFEADQAATALAWAMKHLISEFRYDAKEQENLLDLALVFCGVVTGGMRSLRERLEEAANHEHRATEGWTRDADLRRFEEFLREFGNEVAPANRVHP